MCGQWSELVSLHLATGQVGSFLGMAPEVTRQQQYNEKVCGQPLAAVVEAFCALLAGDMRSIIGCNLDNVVHCTYAPSGSCVSDRL